MNWYLKIELRHGTTEWDIMNERFFLTFSFEDGFKCIDEALQEIKVVIFITPIDPIACWHYGTCFFLDGNPHTDHIRNDKVMYDGKSHCNRSIQR